MSTSTEESVASTHKDDSVVVNHKDNLTANIFGTGDLVIELKYCKWAVHQDKFEDASAFFKKALESDRWKEGQEHYVKLHDDSPIMFARCIQFLYSATYEYQLNPRWSSGDTATAEGHKLSQLLYGQLVHSIPSIDDYNVTNQGITLHRTTVPDRIAHDYDDGIKAASLSAEEQADMDDEEGMSHALVDLAVYQLADKYSISSLQEYALFKFKRNMIPCCHRGSLYIKMFRVVKKVYPDLDLVGDELKGLVSLGIASDYKAIDTGSTHEAADIREWLQADHELCYMVMSRLGRGEDLRSDLGNENYKRPPECQLCRLLDWAAQDDLLSPFE